MQLYDTIAVEDAAIRRTADGYLVAKPRVARTGIQIYGGSEVGKPAMDEVRVYRPEKEVFSKDSLRSYAHRPITINHPQQPVTADNWRKHSVGQTGDEVARDGDFVRIPLMMADAEGIKAFDNGKKELSLGYTCDLAWEKGITPDGQEYDAIQRNIRANHLAVVDRARGGDKLRLGDDLFKKGGMVGGDVKCPNCGKEVPASAKKCPECGHVMSVGKPANDSKGAKKMKTIVADGVSVEIEDDVSANVIARALSKLETRANDAEKSKADLEKEAEAAKKKAAEDSAKAVADLAARDATIAAKDQQLKDAVMTPAKLDALVRDHAEVVTKAKALMGDSFNVDGKTDAEIRKAVVGAKMGDAAKNYADGEFSAAFTALTAGITTTNTGVRDMATAFSGFQPNVADAAGKAWDEANDRLTNAWKMQKTA